jgi:hypothetical protein
MTEIEFLEKHIENKILKYEQQMRGISYQITMQKMVLDRIRKEKPLSKPRGKIEQLTLFAI